MGPLPVPNDNGPLGIPDMALVLTVTLGHRTQARNWTPAAQLHVAPFRRGAWSHVITGSSLLVCLPPLDSPRW